MKSVQQQDIGIILLRVALKHIKTMQKSNLEKLKPLADWVVNHEKQR